MSVCHSICSIINRCILLYRSNRCTVFYWFTRRNLMYHLCCIMCYIQHYEQHKISWDPFWINVIAKFTIQNKTSTCWELMLMSHLLAVIHAVMLSPRLSLWVNTLHFTPLHKERCNDTRQIWGCQLNKAWLTSLLLLL